MEIHGAAYLYALAAAAMAFVGFSAIVVILRQSVGAGLSKFQVLLTLILIEHGFVAVFFCFLPLLLAVFDISHEMVWRISSAIAAVLITVWMADYPLRRHKRARGNRPLPNFARLNFAVTFALMAVLAANAVGYPFRPHTGPYAVAISWILFQGVDIFILSFKAFLRAAPSDERPIAN